MTVADRSIVSRMMTALIGPVPAVRVEVFRTLLTYCLFIYTLAWWQNVEEWLTPAGFHPSGAVTTGLQLDVPLLESGWVWPFAVVYFGSMVAVIVGFRVREALWVLLACLLYATTADRLASFTINKLFIACYTILALAPVSERREGDAEPSLRSGWPLRALQATLLLQYFGAGVCKVAEGDWLEHSDTLFYQAQLMFMTDTAAFLVREAPSWAWAAMQHSALAFELLAPLLFVVRRLRPVAYIWGIGMHVMIALTMHQLVFFSLQIVAFYVLFMDEGRLTRIRFRIGKLLR